MTDKKISQLTSLSSGDLSLTDDLIPVVDSSSSETKKITPQALFEASGLEFDGRSAFVAWYNAGNTATDGSVASDGTVEYVASAGATAISDLLGWLPFGSVTPNHFGVVGAGDETTRMTEWASFVGGKHGVIPPSMIVTISDKLEISADNTVIDVLGVVEQLTYPMPVFFVTGENCRLQGSGTLRNTQTKTNLSESVGNRWYGEVLRSKSNAITALGADYLHVSGLRYEGFIFGLFDFGGFRIWRENISSSGGSSTTFVLDAADQQSDDFYNGWIIRVLNAADGGYRRVTDYDSATNTVTINESWSGSNDGVAVYYLLIKDRSVGVTHVDISSDDVDFVHLGNYTEQTRVQGFSCESIPATQAGGAAPPHAVYLTGDGEYLRHKDFHVSDISAQSCDRGSVVKIRGADGGYVGEVYGDQARGLADVEYVNGWAMGTMVGHRLGGSIASRPYGVILVGGDGPQGGSIRARVSPDYDGGGSSAATLRPVGLLLQSVGSDIERGNLSGGNIDSVSIKWSSSNASLSAAGVLSEDISSGDDGVITGLRVGDVQCDVAGTQSTGVRVVDGDDLFFQSIRGSATNIVQFDAGASECVAFYEDGLASGGVVNNGSGCRVNHSVQASLEVSSTNPIFNMIETDGPTDAKIWQWRNNGGSLELSTRDDANSSGARSAINVRSGVNTTQQRRYINDVEFTRLDATGFALKSASHTRTLQLGAYHLWVDGSGVLRINNGAPSNDTDGVVVGTQS